MESAFSIALLGMFSHKISSRTFTSLDSAPSEALLGDGIFMSSNGGISDTGIVVSVASVSGAKGPTSTSRTGCRRSFHGNSESES